MEIRIYKSKKSLEWISARGDVKKFKIGIGKNEIGHKQREGDLRTPEGNYEICVKNPKSKFFLSLGLNYPNYKDAQAGLANQLITDAEFDAIRRKLDAKEGSVWSTKLGGAIYIHGELDSKSWSEGCIRMMNADIQSIYDEIKIGTPVHIFP